MLLSLLSSIQSELTLLAQANDTQQLQQWEFIEDIISIALYSNAKSTIARTMSIEHVFGNLYFECYNIIRRQNFAHLYRFIPFPYWAMSTALETCNLYWRKEFQQNRTNAKTFWIILLFSNKRSLGCFHINFHNMFIWRKFFKFFLFTCRVRVHFLLWKKTTFIFMNVKMELKSCESYICSFFAVLLNV